MNKKKLQLEQLEKKFQVFKPAANAAPPHTGWIKTVRVSLGAPFVFSCLISQQCDVLKANPMVAWSPPLTGGLHANKKNEIRSAQSRDISLLNLRIVI